VNYIAVFNSGVGDFKQAITLTRNKSYRFSAYSFIPTNANGCAVRYILQPAMPSPANPPQRVEVPNTTASRGSWQRVTATLTSGAGGAREFIVQVDCPISAVTRTIYFDDIVLEEI
jgi:hypothetical protein